MSIGITQNYTEEFPTDAVEEIGNISGTVMPCVQVKNAKPPREERQRDGITETLWGTGSLEGWITGRKNELRSGTNGHGNGLLAVTDKRRSIRWDFEAGSFFDLDFLFGFWRSTTSMNSSDMRGFGDVPFLWLFALESFMFAFVGIEVHECSDARISNGPQMAKKSEAAMVLTETNAAIPIVIEIPEGGCAKTMHITLVGDYFAICVETFGARLANKTHLDGRWRWNWNGWTIKGRDTKFSASTMKLLEESSARAWP